MIMGIKALPGRIKRKFQSLKMPTNAKKLIRVLTDISVDTPGGRKKLADAFNATNFTLLRKKDIAAIIALLLNKLYSSKLADNMPRSIDRKRLFDALSSGNGTVAYNILNREDLTDLLSERIGLNTKRITQLYKCLKSLRPCNDPIYLMAITASLGIPIENTKSTPPPPEEEQTQEASEKPETTLSATPKTKIKNALGKLLSRARKKISNSKPDQSKPDQSKPASEPKREANEQPVLKEDEAIQRITDLLNKADFLKKPEPEKDLDAISKLTTEIIKCLLHSELKSRFGETFMYDDSQARRFKFFLSQGDILQAGIMLGDEFYNNLLQLLLKLETSAGPTLHNALKDIFEKKSDDPLKAQIASPSQQSKQ